MPLTTTEPKFFVIYVFDAVAEDFAIGAIFSDEADAEQYKAECLANPDHFGGVSIVRMTMAQVRATLVKQHFTTLASNLDKLTQLMTTFAGAVSKLATCTQPSSNDHFEEEHARAGGLAFPCYACKHRHGTDMEEPCRTCVHNANSV